MGDLFSAINDEERNLLEALEKAVDSIVTNAIKRFEIGHAGPFLPVWPLSPSFTHACGSHEMVLGVISHTLHI